MMSNSATFDATGQKQITLKKRVGLFGATSLVGQCLLPLLKQNGWQIRAFSRCPMNSRDQNIQWIRIKNPDDNPETFAGEIEQVDCWICVAPVWILPDYFPMLEAHGARRVIAVSSTSRFTKSDSSVADERVTAHKLSEGEDSLQTWARIKGVGWVILRPTLIYGLGQDKNISELVRLIRRLGFFPLAGQAKGLRQPVHAEDVAMACMSALEKSNVVNHAYNLSGGETLTYREMIHRLFAALGLRPRLITVPLWFFGMAAAGIRCFPRYRHWTAQMVERMNANLVFDHCEAVRDLNFSPRKFQLTSKDLPA
jgi:nucleoside-diphosphate-sugar epimerase